MSYSTQEMGSVLLQGNLQHRIQDRIYLQLKYVTTKVTFSILKKNGYVMEKKEVTTSNTAVVCSSLTCVTYL